MSHPTESLASYVDNTLSPADRAEIDGHLRDCATCGVEVEAATNARTSLRALGEVAPPEDLGDAVLREIGAPPQRESGAADLTRQRQQRQARTYRRIGLAAAAVIALIFIVRVPFQGSGSEPNMATSAELDERAPALAPSAAPIADAARTAGDLQALANQERDRYAGYKVVPPWSDTSNGAEQAPNGALSASPVPLPAYVPADDAGTSKVAVFGDLNLESVSGSRVETCLRRGGAYQGGGTLLRTYRGTLDGTPAYFGVFLEGKEAGAKPDRISVWATSVHGCDFLAFVQAFLVYPSPSPPPPGFEVPEV